MSNKKLWLSILLILLLGTFYIISFFVDNNNIQAEDVIDPIEIKEENIEEQYIKVDIKGAVKKPGVYEVKSLSRIIDVINLAGGLEKSANTEYINLAKTVEDEMIIWIYTNSEIKKYEEENIKYAYIEKECNCPDASTSACIGSNEISNDKININTATLEELMTLTGIGESKALNIIEYREQTPFNTIEDIKNISGIGDSAFDKIKDHITV